MAFKEITETGKNFIKHICDKAPEGSLFYGNNGNLPFSKPIQPIDKTWIANVEIEPFFLKLTTKEGIEKLKLGYYEKYDYTVDLNVLPSTLNEETTVSITKNKDLGNALIGMFNYYAYEYELDANILAAQAYIESNYRLWIYNANNSDPERYSTAYGIAQITIEKVYDIIVSNSITGVKTFTEIEKNKIINNVLSPNNPESYNPQFGKNEIAKENVTIIYQNLINNVDLLIKAQARQMKFIATKCDNLASSTLFSYNRSYLFAASTLSQTMKNATNGNGEEYTQKGLSYVIKVFGVLGDPENNLVKKNNLNKNYKPKNYSFGYHNKPYNGAPENTQFDLMKEFDVFEANVSESDNYNIIEENVEKYNDQQTNEVKPLSVITQNSFPYKLIYFPENQYFSNPNKKLQVVLHHTVSGPSVKGDVYYWQNNGERVATAFIVSREGEIYQLYNSAFWGIHLFYDNKPFDKMNQEFLSNDRKIINISQYRELMEKSTIGIELDSYGGLTQRSDGRWQSTYGDLIDSNSVQLYKSGTFPGKRSDMEGFRNYYAFEKYTEKQINATILLIRSLQDRWQFPLTYNEDMWDFSPKAMNNNNGVWTHVSYREDKSDCHPQPELVQKLRSL